MTRAAAHRATRKAQRRREERLEVLANTILAIGASSLLAWMFTFELVPDWIGITLFIVGILATIYGAVFSDHVSMQRFYRARSRRF